MLERNAAAAVLIDGENMGYLLTGKILAQVERSGRLAIQHIYLKMLPADHPASLLGDVWQQVDSRL